MRRFYFILLAVFIVQSVSAQEIVLKGNELFGDLRARQIGPAIMSGRIIDLENHPTNDRVIYAGAAGGGVWKSSNGGASFQPIFDEHPQSIGKIKLDPKNPDNIIWVGTGEIWTRNSVSVGDGLYKSIDGGVTWEKKGFEKSERISGIEINPNNTNEMYVGVLGALWGDSEERGVFKSTDGGNTWSKVLYVSPNTGCADLAMDPKDPNTLYASMWEFRRTGWGFSSGGLNSALYKSTDGGKNWTKIHKGFPAGKLGRIAFAVAPSDSKILYSVIESEKDETKGLYRSDDAGANWTHLNKDFGLVVRPFYFSRIAVDPRNPDVVVKAGLFGSISRDGGKSFKNLGNMHADIHDIIFDIKNSDRMYVACDGGVYRTWDGATTMEIVANIPVSQFYHISVSDGDPYYIYGGLQDNGSWYGPSRSAGGVEARDWHSVGFGDGFRVLKHPKKNIIYSEMQGAENVWRYDIDRKQSKTVQPLAVQGDPKLRFNWNAPMAVSKHNADRFYMGSQFVHKSNDMGDTWVKISPDLTTNDPAKQNQEDSGGLSKDNSGAENHCTVFTIAESPLDENVIWAGTDDGNVQVTQDGGKTWTNTVANITGLPKNTWCYHIEASAHDKATAYAVFDGHTQSDMKPYVYKTSDYGKTWKSLVTPDIYGFTRSIQEDFVKPGLLFLGTEFGLYISVDDGKNWSKFTNNMPATAVHYIDMQRNTNDLVMATHGRGVIIIDDISPLREINQEVLNKEVHFFKTKPMVILEETDFGRTATEMEFVGENPSLDAKIIYYLKKKHIFGKMNLEIFNQEGDRMIEISPGKSKGINVVTWNGLTRQPKMAKAKTLSFGGFTPMRAPAGDYKVVMTKGKETYETSVKLVADPNSLWSDKDRANLQLVSEKLFNMSEELAYMVYEIDETIAHAEKVAATSSSAKKVSKPLIDELTKLKESLVITTGDNYVGSSDPQLREKIATLYSKVASGFTPPSSSEMENLKLLEDTFNKAKSDYSLTKSRRIGKLESVGAKSGVEQPKLMTFEEFLNN
ncbi:MAG: WD40/YVTN/BNR-like repeat-containing protein [Cyclobacteriaceae bacterium]